MSVIREEICPGIHANFVPADSFKSRELTVNFIVPLSRDTAALDALLPSVLLRGTQSYPNLTALQRKLASLYDAHIGGHTGKRGEAQILTFSAGMLNADCIPDQTDVFGETLKVFGEVLFHPLTENGVFSAAYVESEKRNLADAIRAKINNKNAYAVSRCFEEMCAQEIYGIPDTGTVEEAERITPEALYQRYQTVLRDAAVEIFYVGDGEAEQVIPRLREMFCGLTRSAADTAPTAVIRTASGNVREVTEEQPVRQGKLTLGFRTGSVLSDGDYYIYSLFCELYGGSPTSKLFMNVREKLSLCYYCRCISEAQKGLMLVASGIEVDKKDETVREILKQLEAVRRGDITDEEMDAAKKSLVNGYRELTDSAQALSNWYLNRVLSGIFTTPEETAAQVMSVTKAQVAEAAQRLTLDTVYFLKGTLTDAESGAPEA